MQSVAPFLETGFALYTLVYTFLMSSATLYKHAIFSLHGVTGTLAADSGSADTTFTVSPSVLADVTIDVGSMVTLADGGNTSGVMTITAIDEVAETITTDSPPGFAFLAATPTNVVRIPHWAYQWTESSTPITVSPEDPTHPVQAGSEKIVSVRKPEAVYVSQSQSGKTRPQASPLVVEAAAGQTGVVVSHSWPFDVTLSRITCFVEAANKEDRLFFEVGPDSPAGPVTSAVSPGDTVINVNASAAANPKIRPGMMVKLSEGGTTDSLGRLVAVDRVAKTFTVETAAVNSFTTAGQLLLTIVPAWDLPLPGFQVRFSVAGDAILGSEVPVGMSFRITYDNNGASDSRLLVYFGFKT